jgi:hypothetical protein
MAIYSKRSGSECRIVRRAVLSDVRKYDRRKPDASDRRNVAAGNYYVCAWADGTGEFLAATWYLCADGGLGEIEAAALSAETGSDAGAH